MNRRALNPTPARASRCDARPQARGPHGTTRSWLNPGGCKPRWLIPFNLLLLALATWAASENQSTFGHANKLYEEGRYQDAIKGYQTLLTNHPSVAVRFNLGNAFFKSGQIGEAIAQYRQAEFLSPRDPDVLANLRFARQHVAGPSYKPDWVEQKVAMLTSREWTTLATAVVWLFFALLTVRLWRTRWRAALRSWTVLAGVLAAALLICAVWISKRRAETHLAVVTQREAVMRLGPFEESQAALTLKDGAELRVLDRKDDWLQVTAGGRQAGWVQAGRVRQLRRP